MTARPAPLTSYSSLCAGSAVVDSYDNSVPAGAFCGEVSLDAVTGLRASNLLVCADPGVLVSSNRARIAYGALAATGAAFLAATLLVHACLPELRRYGNNSEGSRPDLRCCGRVPENHGSRSITYSCSTTRSCRSLHSCNLMAHTGSLLLAYIALTVNALASHALSHEACLLLGQCLASTR